MLPLYFDRMVSLYDGLCAQFLNLFIHPIEKETTMGTTNNQAGSKLWIGTLNPGDVVTLRVRRLHTEKTGTIRFVVTAKGMTPIIDITRTVHGPTDGADKPLLLLRGASVNGKVQGLVIRPGHAVVVRCMATNEDITLEGRVIDWSVNPAHKMSGKKIVKSAFAKSRRQAISVANY